MDFVVIASTGGAVLENLLNNKFFRDRIRCVVSDRECGAINVANKFGVQNKILYAADGLGFSNLLLNEFCSCVPDLFVSFYTKLFRGEFISFAKYRLVNMHPSILPAFPGNDGFGGAIRYGAKFIGATIHVVDEGMDTGFPIIQSSIPLNPKLLESEVRHLIFQQQCKMLLQLIAWVDQKRLHFNCSGQPVVAGAKYELGEFSPNLDMC